MAEKKSIAYFVAANFQAAIFFTWCKNQLAEWSHIHKTKFDVMAKYVNEYFPQSHDPLRGVQTDTQKLRFNNIQSCIAVVLCVYDVNSRGVLTFNKLVGVHINTVNLDNNEIELNIALSQLKQKDNMLVDVYLVGPYDTQYAGSRLAQKLRYVATRRILLYNFNPPLPGSGVNKDVKVQMNGAIPQVYFRDCVKWQPGVLKDKYNPAKGGVAMTSAQKLSGKHDEVNDRITKPWQMVNNFRILY